MQASSATGSVWPGRLLRLAAACVFATVAFWVAVAGYTLLYLLLIPQHVHRAPVFFDYHARGPPYDLPGARGTGNKGHAQSRGEEAAQSPDLHLWGPTATVDLLAGRRGDWLDFGPPDAPPSAAEACGAWRTRGAAPAVPSRRRASSSIATVGAGVGASAGGAAWADAAGPAVAAVAGPRRSGSVLAATASVLTAGVAYSLALELVLPNSPTNRAAGLVMVRSIKR